MKGFCKTMLAHIYKIHRKLYSHAKLHPVGLYQELHEECNVAVLISNAKQMGNHTQSQHLDEEVCRKVLQLGWMIDPRGLQTSILSPEFFSQRKEKVRI